METIIDEDASLCRIIKEEIAIFGCGKICYSLLRHILNVNKNLDNVNCIIVTSKKYNPTEVLGIKVLSVEEYIYNPKQVILSTCRDDRLQILCELKEKYKNASVYSIGKSLYKSLIQGYNDLSVDILNVSQWTKDDINRVKDQINIFRKSVNSELKSISKSQKSISEVIWVDNFRAVINESKWIKRRDIVTGGMAVSAHYLYALYKMLDSGKFCDILDIGMGQTSKLISQYNAYSGQKIGHTIVESELDWIDFFKEELSCIESIEIVQLEYENIKYNDHTIRTFHGFKEALYDKKYDLISIDAPYGGDMKEYSRVDILSILPECLKKDFVIIVDDIDRVGELNTYNQIKDVLDKYGIEYRDAYHIGIKTFGIISSYSNRFFCKV